MKISFKFFLIIFMVFNSACYAHNVSFPFTNVTLNGNQVLQSSYSFTDSSGTHPIIFCYYFTNNGSNQNVTLGWPYKQQPQSALMPVQLKTNPIYQGDFADNNGTLTVTNNSTVQVNVSCQYALLKNK